MICRSFPLVLGSSAWAYAITSYSRRLILSLLSIWKQVYTASHSPEPLARSYCFAQLRKRRIVVRSRRLVQCDSAVYSRTALHGCKGDRLVWPIQALCGLLYVYDPDPFAFPIVSSCMFQTRHKGAAFYPLLVFFDRGSFAFAQFFRSLNRFLDALSRFQPKLR